MEGRADSTKLATAAVPTVRTTPAQRSRHSFCIPRCITVSLMLSFYSKSFAAGQAVPHQQQQQLPSSLNCLLPFPTYACTSTTYHTSHTCLSCCRRSCPTSSAARCQPSQLSRPPSSLRAGGERCHLALQVIGHELGGIKVGLSCALRPGCWLMPHSMVDSMVHYDPHPVHASWFPTAFAPAFSSPWPLQHRLVLMPRVSPVVLHPMHSC